jgi:hypothetical protein
MGWLPIETAPKDGTKVLVGRFAEGDRDGLVEVDFWHDIKRHGYNGCGRFNAQYWPPTHWMPLPARPGSEPSPDASLMREIVEAMEAAQSALAMMIAPDAIKKTTVANAFATATAAESKVRAALARAEGRS